VTVNLQKWLSGIFALTMMLQAVISVVYVHHSGLAGVEYVSFDHDGALPAALSQKDISLSGPEKSDTSPASDFDSHSSTPYIKAFSSPVTGALKISLSSEKNFEYGLRLPSASISPDLRPPIL